MHSSTYATLTVAFAIFSCPTVAFAIFLVQKESGETSGSETMLRAKTSHDSQQIFS